MHFASRLACLPTQGGKDPWDADPRGRGGGSVRDRRERGDDGDEGRGVNDRDAQPGRSRDGEGEAEEAVLLATHVLGVLGAFLDPQPSADSVTNASLPGLEAQEVQEVHGLLRNIVDATTRADGTLRVRLGLVLDHVLGERDQTH